MGLALAAHTPSDVAVSVRPLNGRDVVWAEFTTDDRTTPLTTESSLPWPHHQSLFFRSYKVNCGNYW